MRIEIWSLYDQVRARELRSETFLCIFRFFRFGAGRTWGPHVGPGKPILRTFFLLTFLTDQPTNRPWARPDLGTSRRTSIMKCYKP